VDKKDVCFLGSSLEDIVAFPDDAKRESGYQLGLLQAGEEPDDWKPFSDIGSGVKEIRIHKNNEYRVMYVTKFKEHIYVLHAFVKKEQKTRKADIDIAKIRYREIKQ
jgi:phage-related protein